MKKLLILSVAVLLLASCNKDDGRCSVCTVNNPLLVTGTEITQTSRSGDASGSCQMSQDEFRETLEDEFAGTGSTITCVYE